MKKTLLILIALCNVFITNAQSSQRLERANKYFERAYYNEVIPIYEQVFENKKSFEVIFNHELLHIAYTKNKKGKVKIKNEWDSLSQQKKTKFKNNHPGYDFSNINVILKEYFSYKYENPFTLVLPS